MKSVRSFLPGFRYSPNSLVADIAVFALFALAWTTSAFCGEIHEAVAGCEIARVEALLKAHPDLVNSRDEQTGGTALHSASGWCDKDMAELLLAHGADVNARANDGSTPLFGAATQGRMEVAVLLLAHGADVNLKDKNSTTALRLAASWGCTFNRMNEYGVPQLREAAYGSNEDVAKLLLAHQAEYSIDDVAAVGDVEKVRALLKAKPGLVFSKDNKMTPLHWAAYAGHKYVAELLLASRAEVNPKDDNGMTPLHYAAENGNKDVVELLLAHKADVNATDNNGQTPLQHAAVRRYAAVGQVLLANKAKFNLQQVAAVGDLERVRALLKENPALAFTIDIESWTPLCYAAANGQKDVAELLLANNAPRNAKGYANTALSVAAYYGHKDVAELLLAHKARVNARDSIRQTPLHSAAEEGYTDVAELLLAHNADVNAKDFQGMTPLLWAAVQGRTDIVELLLDHKAAVNPKNKKGRTPLCVAADMGNKDVSELLRRHGGHE